MLTRWSRLLLKIRYLTLLANKNCFFRIGESKNIKHRNDVYISTNQLIKDKEFMNSQKFTKKEINIAINKINESLSDEQGYERSVLGWFRDVYQSHPSLKSLRVGELLHEINTDHPEVSEDYLAFWIDQIFGLFPANDPSIKRVTIEGYEEPIDVTMAAWDELDGVSADKKAWDALNLLLEGWTDDWDLEAFKEVNSSGHSCYIYPKNKISKWNYEAVSERLLDLDHNHNL